MKISISPKYIPLTQQKYCCFPCCIQWVMLRRGLKLIPQEKIAKELGLVIPPEDERLFNEKMKVVKKLPKGKNGFGIWNYNVPRFLKKYKVPIKTEIFYPSKIKNVPDFMIENLKKGNDVIVSLNVGALANPKTPVNYVHSLVIDSVEIKRNKTIVTLGDPAYTHKKFFEVELDKILSGMSKKYGKEKSFKVFYSV